jgi:hypothetical protein
MRPNGTDPAGTAGDGVEEDLPAAGTGPAPAHDQYLAALLSQSVVARDGLADALRTRGPAQRLVPAARARLLAALEAYASALDARNLPIPRRLRDDLRLQRALATARDNRGRRLPGADLT